MGSFTGSKAAANVSKKSGHFKLLLVAHSACRTGAPLCLLELAHQLSLIADFDCHIVLQQGASWRSHSLRSRSDTGYRRLGLGGDLPG